MLKVQETAVGSSSLQVPGLRLEVEPSTWAASHLTALPGALLSLGREGWQMSPTCLRITHTPGWLCLCNKKSEQWPQ